MTLIRLENKRTNKVGVHADGSGCGAWGGVEMHAGRSGCGVVVQGVE